MVYVLGVSSSSTWVPAFNERYGGSAVGVQVLEALALAVVDYINWTEPAGSSGSFANGLIQAKN